MNDFVERYVHQVGIYLPKNERAEIEAELRSQIQDQVDDRYGATPTDEELATVLRELGHPRQIAASYNREQYLVGPDLYPFMLAILRYGWLLIPSILIFLHIFTLLTAPQANNSLWNLLVEPLIGTLQASLIFSALVVFIFALLERSGLKRDMKAETFNPLDLPEVADPASVDRYESAFGIALGIVVELFLLYFLRVGGLTLQFNLSDSVEVMLVPLGWLTALIITILVMIIINALVLRHNRWNASLWFIETLFEVFGVFCLYFVLYKPLIPLIPALSNLSFVDMLPEALVLITAIGTLLSRGNKQIKLWNYQS